VEARLSDQDSGFNYWLSQACASQTPAPDPFEIDWTDGSTNFWHSFTTPEDLDATSSPGDGPICLVYGRGLENQNLEKFTVFAGTVEIAVEFDLAWEGNPVPSDTESLADATDDAMFQTFNAQSYYASFSDGVIWNGQLRCGRGPLRQSGPGWRQRLAYQLTFEVRV
jgi:hypothetical protein